MTGIRYSVAIAEESTFGEGAGSNKFYTLSAGAYMSATANISTETVFSPGSKFFDTAIYGRLSGSFEIDFVLSYEYLGLFKLVFERSSRLMDIIGANKPNYFKKAAQN